MPVHYCFTIRAFTPTMNGLSILFGANESQQTVDWYPETCSPTVHWKAHDSERHILFLYYAGT